MTSTFDSALERPYRHRALATILLYLSLNLTLFFPKESKRDNYHGMGGYSRSSDVPYFDILIVTVLHAVLN